jgi:hypothetical protein
LAERIELITATTPVPTIVAPQPTIDTDAVTPQLGNDGAGAESETETPVIHATKIATPASTPKIVSFEGILISMDQSIWKINAVFVEAGKAEIKGIPVIGATVKAEGYFGTNGIFIASKLEIINNGLSDNDPNSNNDDGNINGNTNTDDNSNGSNDNSGGGNGNNDNGGGHGNGG